MEHTAHRHTRGNTMHPHLSQALVQSNQQDLIRHADQARLASECRTRSSRARRLHRLLIGSRLRGAGLAAPESMVGARGGAAIAR